MTYNTTTIYIFIFNKINYTFIFRREKLKWNTKHNFLWSWHFQPSSVPWEKSMLLSNISEKNLIPFLIFHDPDIKKGKVSFIPYHFFKTYSTANFQLVQCLNPCKSWTGSMTQAQTRMISRGSQGPPSFSRN